MTVKRVTIFKAGHIFKPVNTLPPPLDTMTSLPDYREDQPGLSPFLQSLQSLLLLHKYTHDVQHKVHDINQLRTLLQGLLLHPCGLLLLSLPLFLQGNSQCLHSALTEYTHNSTQDKAIPWPVQGLQMGRFQTQSQVLLGHHLHQTGWGMTVLPQITMDQVGK